MRFGVLAVLLACAVLVLAGCRATLSVDVAVDAQGAGTFSLTVATDDELDAHLQEAETRILTDLVDAAGDAESWTAEAEPASDPRQVTLTGQFADPESFAELAGELTEALDAPEVTLLEDIALNVSDDQIAVSGVASAMPEPAVSDFGVEPEQAVALIADHDAFAYDISVAFPDEVQAADGTVDADTNTVQWHVAPGERLDFSATSARPQQGPWELLAGAGAAGLLVLAVLSRAVFARRRGRGRHAR